MNMVSKFTNRRSKSYKNALESFPNVWKQDLNVMYDYLSPQSGEVIVELGAGSGFYSVIISKEIGNKGKLLLVEPSLEQLLPVLTHHKNTNMEFFCEYAEEFVLQDNQIVDKVWTRGAFHHVQNKELVMRNLSKICKNSAKVLIFDIFSASTLATFFDSFVSLACETGHEVSFLSKEYAKSMCLITGWKSPQFIDIPLQWEFDKHDDIGKFLSMLLNIKSEYSDSDVQTKATETLGIEVKNSKYYLNWPMTLMITEKE